MRPDDASVFGAFVPATNPKSQPLTEEGLTMPRTNYCGNRRGGHCPDHVRDTFLAAIEAYENWNDGEPEPTVEFEVGYVPRQIPISKACGLVWNCTDILPGLAWDSVEGTDLIEDVKHRTYGAVARAMRYHIGLALNEAA
jgi:hypothetical protein